MKHLFKSALVLAFFGISPMLSAQNMDNFCVVELFTSEGCSSCPPADNTLNTAASNAETSANNHLFVALHIEYWDYIGWVDPFGNSAFDNMFFDYYNSGNGIQIMTGNSFGTPLFVRNGEQGRNWSAATSNKTSTSWVDMYPVSVSATEVVVNYDLTGDLTNSNVRFYLVESDLTSVVTAGENAGSTLHHNNVARDMKVVGSSISNGTVTLDIPAGANPNNMRVMAYIRKNSSAPWDRDITGANKGFRLNEVGVSEASLAVLSIAPNPAATAVHISGDAAIERITMYNEYGALVKTVDSNAKTYQLDITDLMPGIYHLEVQTAQGVQTKKLVKL